MKISKGPSDPRQAHRPVFFYSSAREGLGDMLSNLTGSERRVLLPAFIGWSANEGSGVFDPVEALGWSADFYRVDRTLAVDVDHLSRALDANTYGAVVLIHYFGRSDPRAAAVRDLVTAHATPLVEDLAHGFYTAYIGQSATGSVGDVALYSMHKMLPIAQGGVAVYNDRNLVRGQSTTMPRLPEVMLSYDWKQIAARRRRNFFHGSRLLNELQSRIGGFQLAWPDLSPDDVPQTLPVFICGQSRDALYEEMNAAGFGVVSLYHTLIPSIGPEYKASHWVAAHILNLPVHQDMSLQAVEALVERFGICIRAVGERES